MWIALAALVGFGWIGFLDDYAKVTRQRNLGLTGRRKLAYQFSMGFAFAAALLFLRAYGEFSTTMNVPFLKQFQPFAAVRIADGAPVDCMCWARRRSAFSWRWWWCSCRTRST